MRAGRVFASLPWLAMTIVISPLAGGCSSTTGGGGQSGGQTSAGGTTSSGGARAAGGTTSSGGTDASGGKTSAGGTTTNGGTTGAGGVTGSGGLPKSGGASGSGGVASAGGVTGGVTGSGGATVATGGANTGGAKTGGAGGGTVGSGGTSGSGGVVGGGGGTSGGMSNDGSIGSGGAGGGTGACPSISDFATWPSGKGPADIGKLAVNNFKSHTGDAYSGAGYAWTFSYFGSLQFAKLTGDTTNSDYLISKFDCTQAGPSNTSTSTVDDRAFGDLPLEIYLENQSATCKTLGLLRADTQWASTTSDGITKDARYWADDMYMITGLQVFAYRATQDSKYLDRAAKTMMAYVTALQQSNGLFWHTKDSKAHWGRANGWVAAGMTELLLDLPTGTTRDSIMAAYKKMMDGLLTVQISGGTDDGCWRQVLDLTPANAESSCTAMFTYALVNGAKNAWLTDAKYSAAAKKGWTALGNKTNSSGQLSQVCPGTGAAPSGTLSSQQQFYASIALGSNDMHGQAPLLWTAKALLRTDCPGVP